jgi:hypothetical protein
VRKNRSKSLDNERRITDVEAATARVPTINTNVIQIFTDVKELRGDVGNMSTNINSAISTMNSKNNDFLSRLDLSLAQLTAAAGQSLPQISNGIASIEQRMQSLSDLEERLQTLSSLEQILGMQDARVQATPQFTLQRLLAKPSRSREIYDSISHSASMETHRDSGHTALYDWFINTGVGRQSCSCMYRGNRRRTSRGFASLWLRTESSHHEHNQDCELSKMVLSKSRHKFEMTATRPFSFLPWSLEIAFALTTGAGGFSISPNITLRPIVDAKKSPVFLILKVLEFFWISGSYTDTELSSSLSATKNTILELYCQKKAFANEVVETPWSRATAISRMSVMIRCAPKRSFNVRRGSRNRQTPVGALSDTIVELVQAGLPVDGYDQWGR